MRVTVFGASGNVGRLVVEEALRRGYEVVAFTHSQSKLPKRAGLSVKQGDVHDSETVAAAIKGSDAVISALGSWGTPSKDILTAGMRGIVPAMQANGVKRVISLTGSDARAAGDDLSVIHRISRNLFKIIGRRIINDGERHIRVLEASGLDWTVLRSPRMSKRGSAYRLGRKRPAPWASVGHESVATCLVDQLTDTEHIKQAPFITRA